MTGKPAIVPDPAEVSAPDLDRRQVLAQILLLVGRRESEMTNVGATNPARAHLQLDVAEELPLAEGDVASLTCSRAVRVIASL